MKRLIAALALLVMLTGCDTYLKNHPDEERPELPEGCVALYKHTEGNDIDADEYQGIYCKTDLEVTKS